VFYRFGLTGRRLRKFLALGTPIRQGAIMGYVSYVGRVGALAVVLGVGTAVATMPGVA
jgi:hypothetical protein